ncbi:cellulase family glycosylhydrolase [Paludisphaera mucosa]|uniref:Cellulase family glycosylhydrolase n=1 Tax=Paludisphaera mucosa TaxID=3030827 RepID=A0ABT6FBW9_9BACT|nr:cellulase family glycosylhydrolase [Paludisphaera mucosa]MDG3005042.1 cellulase family glycosylhydrolase [Paludisphaera mucosa]
MKPRVFYSLSPVVALGLAWSLHLLAAAAAQRAEGPAPKIEGRDWTWRIQPDGGVRVLCKGSVVLESSQVYWGAKWAWSGAPDAAFKPGADGGGTLTATVPGLKTAIAGAYRSPRPNVLEMELKYTSTEALAGVVGGGLHWTFRPQSPVLGGRAGAPTVPPGGLGWTWEPARGATIHLAVAPALAKVEDRGGVRLYLLSERIDPGTKTFRMTLTLPEGATREPRLEERYDPATPERWFSGAMAWDASPVDLRFLNADDRPAGRRGPVRAAGDGLVLGDGTPARFWGANLAAYALFASPREAVAPQARRMAQMGFNLMRIHHHDSSWVTPNAFGVRSKSTRRLDPAAMETLDWWIKCLKDEGIYVWLDLHVGRTIQPDDGLTEGKDEVAQAKGALIGFSYFNAEIQGLMREFQEAYLAHVNAHTGLAYKDDPAVAAVLVTNENDLNTHYGTMFIPVANRPSHTARFTKEYQAFAREYDLPEGEMAKTWQPGPSKLFLADAEHRFNGTFLDDLRRLGLRALTATTNYWGNTGLFSLPGLCDGDVVDVHSYGLAEALGTDPRYEANYISWTAAAQVAGKPLTVSEWNAPFPIDDRFTAPLYMASLAAFQGWDAPMIYSYSFERLVKPQGPSVWSTYYDPALAGVMPAAALLYRRGQVAPARTTYHLALTPAQLFDRNLTPESAAALRTIAEQGRLTIGLPKVRELPWLKPSPVPEGATVVDDPDRDMIPEGATSVRSDTGQLVRDWKRGVQVIDAPQCQAASGWIGGEPIATTDARFEMLTKKAVVALNSVDDRPLAKSRFILITAVARAVADPTKRSAFASEPVIGTVSLKTEATDLELLALAPDGRIAGRSRPRTLDGALRIILPDAGGTHWYVLKPRAPDAAPKP